MDDTIYQCDTRETREFVVDILEAGLVPFVRSSPGCGKSAIISSVANQFFLRKIDHRLSTSAPEDMTGLPEFQDLPENQGRFARFAPFIDIFPLQGIAQIPDGMNGWLLFLDEFNSAPRSVQAASYKLILDRMVGQYHLHSNVFMACAGNLDSDRAIVEDMSTAMQSRLVHIHMKVVFEHFLKDVMLKQNWDPRIISFLSYKPSLLMDFNPDHEDKTFCCPRTWEFMHKLIQGKEVTDRKVKLYGGTITSGVAVEFVKFTQVYSKLPNIQVIRAHPEDVMVPSDEQTRYAVIGHMLEHFSENDFGLDIKYINRFPAELRVLYFRGLIIRHKDAIRTHPDFRKGVAELARYLHDDDEQPKTILAA